MISTLHPKNNTIIQNHTKGFVRQRGLQFHKLTSKGLDFDFSVQEDVGFQFFLGGSLDFNIQSSYQWKF